MERYGDKGLTNVSLDAINELLLATAHKKQKRTKRQDKNRDHKTNQTIS